MVIDVFLDRKVFDDLSVANTAIYSVCDRFMYAEEDQPYDLAHNKLSFWYNPRKIWDLSLSHEYPHKSHGLTKDPKFNLVIYFPNYVSIYLIDLLFRDRDKTMLVEDQAGGDGRFFAYLSRLGYKNFHITENFTQLNQQLLNSMMREFKIACSLNQPNTEPVIMNLVGWTHMTRAEVPASAEIFCVYNNPSIVKEIDGAWNIRSSSGEYIKMNMVKLCQDVDKLMNVFCREDKYEEFMTKIKSRGIIL